MASFYLQLVKQCGYAGESHRKFFTASIKEFKETYFKQGVYCKAGMQQIHWPFVVRARLQKILFIFIGMKATDIIRQLQLLPHPEGGFYKEVYRSTGTIAQGVLPSSFGGDRNFSTSIYYLLQQSDYSGFHRIKSDELWHFYAGGPLLVHCLSKETGYTILRLGSNLAEGDSFQAVVPAGVWFATEPAPGTDFALAGCTVSPGFDFHDFEMAKRENLQKEFPEHFDIVNRLCR